MREAVGSEYFSREGNRSFRSHCGSPKSVQDSALPFFPTPNMSTVKARPGAGRSSLHADSLLGLDEEVAAVEGYGRARAGMFAGNATNEGRTSFITSVLGSCSFIEGGSPLTDTNVPGFTAAHHHASLRDAGLEEQIIVSPGGGGASLVLNAATLSQVTDALSSPSNPALDAFPSEPPSPAAPPSFTFREALEEDAEGIVALRETVDMTGAFALMWPIDDLRRRIRERSPLIVVALASGEADGRPRVVGVTGIDIHGMENTETIYSVGSRELGVSPNSLYTFDRRWCECRGLIIHPSFQGAGLGSRMHMARMKLLSILEPNTPGVIMGIRARVPLDEAMAIISPLIEAPRDTVTPVFTKEQLFQVTYHTSQGIVHMLYGREREGWKLGGIHLDDGGQIWFTTMPLPQMVANFAVDVAPAR